MQNDDDNQSIDPNLNLAEKIYPFLNSELKIIEKIENKENSQIFKAKQILTNRIVRIKLYDYSTYSASNIEKLKQKILPFASFNSPQIAKLYYLGTTDRKDLFTVNEFVEGKRLNTLIKEMAPLAEELCVKIALDISKAIEYTHKEGFYYACLSPNDIEITPDYNAQLLEFPEFLISENSSLAEKNYLTNTNNLKTLNTLVTYLAPEIMAKNKFSQSSDFYSLGCILYEMLTGETFRKNSLFFKSLTNTTQKIELAKLQKYKFHPQLTKILIALLNINPEIRQKNTNNLIQQLEQILASNSLSKIPNPNLGERDSRKKNKFSITILCFVSIFTILFFIIKPIAYKNFTDRKSSKYTEKLSLSIVFAEFHKKLKENKSDQARKILIDYYHQSKHSQEKFHILDELSKIPLTVEEQKETAKLWKEFINWSIKQNKPNNKELRLACREIARIGLKTDNPQDSFDAINNFFKFNKDQEASLAEQADIYSLKSLAEKQTGKIDDSINSRIISRDLLKKKMESDPTETASSYMYSLTNLAMLFELKNEKSKAIKIFEETLEYRASQDLINKMNFAAKNNQTEMNFFKNYLFHRAHVTNNLYYLYIKNQNYNKANNLLKLEKQLLSNLEPQAKLDYIEYCHKYKLKSVFDN